MHLHNYMEDIIRYMMKSVLSEVIHCSCERCLADITALALNELPPKYIVSEKGAIYVKVQQLQQQFEVDATAAIIKAAQRVNAHPRH